jgi:hypothetical protein
MAVLSDLSIERNVYKIRRIFFVARKLSSKVQLLYLYISASFCSEGENVYIDSMIVVI